MINLSEQQALKYIVNYGYYIADEIICDSEKDLDKYIIGKIVSLGDVCGKIIKKEFFPKATQPKGIVHFRILAEPKLDVLINIKEYKHEE